MKPLKQHPLSLAEGVWKNLFLLIFPLIRGLLALKFDVYRWIEGAWFDMLIVAIIIVYAFLRYKSKCFFTEDGFLRIKSGFLLKNKSDIPLSELTTVCFMQNPVYRFLGAVKVLIETNSGFVKAADFSITLSKKNSAVFEESIKSKVGVITKKHYLPRMHFIVLYSLQSTSTLSGILLISAFFSQSAAILGRHIQDDVLDSINDFANKIVLGIPPVAIAISVILLAGWSIAFVFNTARYLRFSISRSTDKIVIKKGLLIKQKYILSAPKITAVEKRQSLLTKALGISSVFVSCAGYGKSKNESSVIFPAVGNAETDRTLSMILPEFTFAKNTLRPKRSAWKSYLFFPAVLILLITPAFLLLPNFSVRTAEFIRFSLIIMLIPCIWLAIVRLFAFFSSGISVDTDDITISYVKGFSFRKLCCKKKSIVKTEIVQNPLGKLSGKCTLLIWCAGEKAVVHKILGLSYDDAVIICEKSA